MKIEQHRHQRHTKNNYDLMNIIKQMTASRISRKPSEMDKLVKLDNTYARDDIPMSVSQYTKQKKSGFTCRR